MKLFFFISLFICLQFCTLSQNAYEIKGLKDVNTPADEMACTIIGRDLIYMTSEENDLVNDYKWNAAHNFHLESIKRGDTFSNWNTRTLFLDSKQGDCGPASYDPVDSILYFSASDNFGKAKGNHLKIYTQKQTEDGWKDPELLSVGPENFDCTHPFYDAKKRLLVFSSNMPGGSGNMDIWFVYKLDSGWGEPVNLGMMVNSAANEIFPVVFEDDIVYSTNVAGGHGGYDLKIANGDAQWKTSTTMEAPFNSNADDLQLLLLTDEKSLLTSNRGGGVGGDDVYIIEKMRGEEDKHKFTAVLECLGQPDEGAKVAITNEYGEVVVNETTDSTGHINIEPLRLNRNYRIQLGGIDPSAFTDCVMSIYDENGNKLRELHFNMNGFADLELLPLSYHQLQLLSLEDKSLLNINIEGQLFDEHPGDVGSDEPITILDEDGVPVAIAYTNESGKFRFTKVEPQLEYTFKLSPETAASNMLVMDKGQRITLPVLDAEVKYQRVSKQDAIELVNEYNERIVVSPRDIFVINRIYYEYNSSTLTPEASAQLDQLSIILDRNDSVGLELRSHTDSRGNDDYNLALSQKRAKAAVEYLIEQGANASRFKPIGMGETELLNECDDGVKCSDPEHSINRRTEIRLTKIAPAR